MGFREMKDYELARLTDEELIAHVVTARRAGALQAARLGLGIFAQRRFDDLVRRALGKVGSRDDAEDLAARTIGDAFEAAFNGEVIGEAIVFLHRILSRRIADFYRAREGKETEPLPEDLDDEERRRRDAAISPDETGKIELDEIVAAVFEKLSDPHKRVVDDYIAGYNGAETAERVNNAFPDLDPPMSDQNVHQIVSRFRKDLRAALEQN